MHSDTSPAERRSSRWRLVSYSGAAAMSILIAPCAGPLIPQLRARLQELRTARRHRLEIEGQNAELARLNELLEVRAASVRDQARLLDLAHDAIFVRGLETDNIDYWNTGAEELYGWTRAEAMGQQSHILLKSQFPIPLRAIEEQVLRTGRWDGEIVHTCRDGSTLTVASRWALRTSEEGVPNGILEINSDISEQKVAEAEIRALNADLEERVRERTAQLQAINRELTAALEERDRLLAQEHVAREQAEAAQRLRDEFLSVASHELKTPLTSLQLQLQLLNRMLERDHSAAMRERFGNAVQTIERQSKRLTRLTNDLLNVSRGEGNEITIRREPVDLGALTRDVTDIVIGAEETNGSRIELNTAPDVQGYWDSFALEQVVTNLLTNALKFGREGSIQVRVWSDGSHACLSVQDHGLGIASEDQERIFERFERAVPAQNYGGFGLGLYITRRIVEAHGGDIRVESGLGDGTTFVVRLPQTEPVPVND